MANSFMQLYLSRTFKIIKKYKLVLPGDKVFVALSGGKDSGACLWTIKKYVHLNNINADVVGFHLNFGLPHSDKVQEVVEKQAKKMECKLEVVNVKDYGIDMQKLDTRKRPMCSYCGTIKRYLLNKVPRELDATKLATGHHMDDFLVFFFKNLLTRNYSWITKFKPLLGGDGKMLARIRPLYEVGGRENEELCKKEDIPFLEEDICPYAILGKRADPKLRKCYELLYSVESWQKDFRLLMIRSMRKVIKYLPEEKQEYKYCSICGEPTSQEICGFCKIKNELEKSKNKN